MKNWAKPEVKNLGFENTFSNGGNGGEHWCHTLNEWHGNGCGHNHGGGACKDPNHPWDEAHKASCCCGNTGSNPVPGLS